MRLVAIRQPESSPRCAVAAGFRRYAARRGGRGEEAAPAYSARDFSLGQRPTRLPCVHVQYRQRAVAVASEQQTVVIAHCQAHHVASAARGHERAAISVVLEPTHSCSGILHPTSRNAVSVEGGCEWHLHTTFRLWPVDTSHTLAPPLVPKHTERPHALASMHSASNGNSVLWPTCTTYGTLLQRSAANKVARRDVSERGKAPCGISRRGKTLIEVGRVRA